MKKASIRVLFVAAIVSLMGITAFAAFGGLDLIRGIFGDSAASIQDQIVTPQVSASANGRELALEALVTDGYVTNLVVSLTGQQPSDPDLFTVSTDLALRSNGWRVYEEFSTAKKTCYVVDLVSEQRFQSADITLSLNRDVAPIELPIRMENKLGNAVISFPDGAMSGKTALKELQVSPMGFLLIAHEDDAQGGLPATRIRLLFQNGTSEEMEAEFTPSEDRVLGGGGVVMSNDPKDAPLVVSFHGTRNPDGELVVSGQFSRIINPAEIQKVVVDGAEYPVH